MDVLISAVGLFVAFSLLAWFASRAKYIPRVKKHRSPRQPAKPRTNATVKPQAPTEEELLLAMSDTELLRELVRLQRMSLRSQQSQTRVSRLGIFGFLALFSGGE